MAVSIMKKFTIVAHKDHREEIITELRKAGITEIEFKEKVIAISELKEIENIIAILEYLINHLAPHLTKHRRDKIFISHTELQELLNNYNIKNIYEQINEILTEIATFETNIQTAENKIKFFRPWRNLNKNISELKDTENLKFLFCSCKPKVFDKLKESIKDKLSDLSVVSEYEKEIYFVIVTFVTAEKQIRDIIKQLGITTYTFEFVDETPAGIISNTYKEIILNQRKLTKATKRIKTITEENLNKLLILYDYYSELYKIKSAEEKIQYTQETSILEGWVPETSENKLKSLLSHISDAIEVYTRYPRKNENPPIVFKNNSIISPFEFLTTLFDRPKYTEFDPTPLFAPFFAVFFALCVSDIFYGIIAATVGLLGLYFLSKKPGFNPDSGMCKLFKIILFCGALTIFAGIITDSFAGFGLSNIFTGLKKIVFINPIKEPIKMLVLSLLLGVIQLVFGMFIKLIKSFNSKDFLSIIDQLLWIALIISVIPLAYLFMFGKIISTEIVNISKLVFPKILILFLVFVIGRRIITKPIECIPAVFGITGLFGDTMSYSRIFGIALAGAAIAKIINEGVIALLKSSYIGYFFAAILFVFGHSINFLMNLLGAFVHSARLQYLEFFSKFFEGGGKPFQPFCKENKYTITEV